MVRAEAEVLVGRAVDQVFKFVADDFVVNYPRWSPEVQCFEAITAGPMRVGWVGRQVRLDRGRRSDSQFCVTVFESGRRLGFDGTTAPYRIDYRFEPGSMQTRIAFGFELLELSVALWPFRHMVQRAVQETAERTVENLKCLLEEELLVGVGP